MCNEYATVGNIKFYIILGKEISRSRLNVGSFFIFFKLFTNDMDRFGGYVSFVYLLQLLEFSFLTSRAFRDTLYTFLTVSKYLTILTSPMYLTVLLPFILAYRTPKYTYIRINNNSVEIAERETLL